MANDTTYQKYYVPAQSRLPIWMAFGMFLTVYGAGRWLGDSGPGVFMAGSLVLAAVMYVWFSQVIKENHAGLNNDQLKRSYVWGMGWFIFSEVMFFAAFFGALYYVRSIVGPWLGGEGEKGVTNYLYEGFQFSWPALSNPDNSLFPPPDATIPALGVPLINTLLLVTSSFTLHFGHHALIKDNRSTANVWMIITIVLGIAFLFLQGYEYYEAYAHLGLTLNSGIYGTTFFMLTGFHGAHVTIGTLMLIIMWLRLLNGHFKPDDHFGFQAASWYWHFVDVVWLCLFFLVYLI